MNEERWRPVRAGIVNVWRYDEEVFEFHHGRLLFRGPNGSGKSMALELLLPFLFDANAAPSRLSSGTKARGGLLERLLTGSGQQTRVGFLWAEFSLGDRSFTAGVRLRASDSTKKVTYDWFTTKLRVGHGLDLIDEDRTPVSKARLEELLGHDGIVHDTADAYREAVRSTLFAGFGRPQYDAMINALLALRREKISQDLSPDRLSEILSAALPPLDEHEITEVAEGYEKLDRRKDNLRRLEADVGLVGKLAARQRAYARVVLGAAANEVRTAESQRDLVTRREREAKRKLGEASGRRRSQEVELEDIDRRIRDHASEADALRERDAYKAGGAIEQLRQELGRQRQARERCDDDVRDREADVDTAAAARDQAEMNLAAARSNEQRTRQETDTRADTVGASAVVGQASEIATDEGEKLVDAWVRGREEQVAAVRQALRTLGERIGDRNRWEEQVEADQGAFDREAAELQACEEQVERAWDVHRTDVTAWIRSCTILDLEGTVPDEPAVLAQVARERSDILRTALTLEKAGHSASAVSVQAQHDDLEVERAELASGRTSEPDAPTWRSPRARAGAPLWRLVDFEQGCDSRTRDGVESALTASGLLDAWIAEDGTVTLPDGLADVLLDPTLSPTTASSLATVLQPLDDTAVARHVIARALSTVAFVPDALNAELPMAVGADGSFRLGSLSGRGALVPASFVGAAAQERRRIERIAAIDRELQALRAELERLATLVEDIERRLSLLDAEVARVPSGAAIRAAVQRVEVAAAVLGRADARVQESRRKRDEASAAVREAQAHLMRLALAHSLPTGDAELQAYAAALEALRRHVEVWSRLRRNFDRAAADLRDAEQRAMTAVAKLAPAQERLAAAVRVERDLDARLRTLDAHVGAEYREIVGRLDQLAQERRVMEQQQTDVSKSVRELSVQIGKLETLVEAAEDERQKADEQRTFQQSRFVAVVTEGVASEAALDVELGRLDGVTAVLDAARSIAQKLGDVPVNDRARDSAHSKLSEVLHETKQSLAGAVDFYFDQSDNGWWLLRAATDGLRRTVGQLHHALQSELVAARDELQESEQRLFDETLTGTVRQAVADRIRRCTELVVRINEQLAAVRTAAASVQVRLRWEVDPEEPEAVRSARALLLKDPAALTDAERAGLYAFFRARLDQVRAGLDGSAGWDVRLREALDYRSWHRFAVDVAHRDWPGFVTATPARIQRLSTGERSMALHLPMLASITAHYGGAGTSVCPRLILLDELFAGVDTANRGQLFGMLVTWDLDAVLTSDHEWCAYASLDGIAIHFLHPAQGAEPVTSTRFVWDGRQRTPSAIA